LALERGLLLGLLLSWLLLDGWVFELLLRAVLVGSSLDPAFLDLGGEGLPLFLKLGIDNFLLGLISLSRSGFEVDLVLVKVVAGPARLLILKLILGFLSLCLMLGLLSLELLFSGLLLEFLSFLLILSLLLLLELFLSEVQGLLFFFLELLFLNKALGSFSLPLIFCQLLLEISTFDTI